VFLCESCFNVCLSRAPFGLYASAQTGLICEYSGFYIIFFMVQRKPGVVPLAAAPTLRKIILFLSLYLSHSLRTKCEIFDKFYHSERWRRRRSDALSRRYTIQCVRLDFLDKQKRDINTCVVSVLQKYLSRR
jgi:hypothetical protein